MEKEISLLSRSLHIRNSIGSRGTRRARLSLDESLLSSSAKGVRLGAIITGELDKLAGKENNENQTGNSNQSEQEHDRTTAAEKELADALPLDFESFMPDGKRVIENG